MILLSFLFLSLISFCQPVLISKIPVQLSVHEGKNRHQPVTENAKSRYRIDFENLLVRKFGTATRYHLLIPDHGHRTDNNGGRNELGSNQYRISTATDNTSYGTGI
ncbi:hypothetical protein Hanom_Chr06g00481681 [Helianthus anomalus]